MELIRHPATPSAAVEYIGVSIARQDRGLDLAFAVGCDTARLAIPAPAKPYRTDGLWRTTCFELFVTGPAGGYREFNLSPSGQWAAYRFDAYREGMAELGLDEPPRIWLSREYQGLLLTSLIALDVDPAARIGLSAVIEEADGAKSYWALAHPAGKPDFHHPDCFALELPAPDAP